jgi:hypothetical protein
MNTTSPPTRGPARRPARQTLALTALAVLGALALPAAAAVYKWVDPQGVIHYSDLPPPPEGKLLSVDTSAHTTTSARTSEAPRPAQMPAAATAMRSATTGPAASPEAAARLKQTVDSDVSNARADQCKQAQEKYANYIRSRRLYKTGANGERIYLTDQELETERLNAKHEVDEFCGG